MSTVYNFKYLKVKNYHATPHHFEIPVDIGLMLILVVLAFSYFYIDTNLKTYPPLNNNVTLYIHR